MYKSVIFQQSVVLKPGIMVAVDSFKYTFINLSSSQFFNVAEVFSLTYLLMLGEVKYLYTEVKKLDSV